jgi:hypothetical protein
MVIVRFYTCSSCRNLFLYLPTYLCNIVIKVEVPPGGGKQDMKMFVRGNEEVFVHPTSVVSTKNDFSFINFVRHNVNSLIIISLHDERTSRT